MAKDLPRATPAEHDVDPSAVLAFVDSIEADPAIEVHSLMVVKHGYVLAEGWWAPHTPDRARLLYSLSKSFTSTALGFALREGRFGLDDPVVSHFPEFEREITDPRSRSITLRHVASMASGHNRETMLEALAADPEEPVRGFLLIPPDAEPGSLFAYNQPCTYSVASVIQRAAGMPLTAYLRPRLFDPLGIGEVGWLTWPPGREQGFTGLFARTEDVAKLGLLYLRNGRWGDTQLLPESYVAEATSRQVDNPGEPNPDWQQGYGFQFWMSRHGYRGDGAYGQFCVVLPEHDAVIAMTAGTEAMQAVLDRLWAHLLPGLSRVDADTGRQDELAKRLRELRLPPCPAPLPPATGLPAATGERGSFRVMTDGVPFTEVRIGPGFEVTLVEPGDSLTFPVGAGDWLVTEAPDGSGVPVAVAASGGRTDEDTLRIEVIFLETPHRMDIECRPGDRTATAVWRNPPLMHTTLRTLRRPR